MLLFVEETEGACYSDVLGHTMKNRIVASDASVSAALNYFTELGLLSRRVSQERPIRTTYSPAEKGKKILKVFQGTGTALIP